MNASDFQKVLEETLDKVIATLGQKAGEYANDGDRLHNFKQAAHVQQITPRQALMGMLAKHTISIYDMGTSEDIFDLAKWDEKIGDHINYLILLRAIVTEEATLAAEIKAKEVQSELKDVAVAMYEDSKGYPRRDPDKI